VRVFSFESTDSSQTLKLFVVAAVSRGMNITIAEAKTLFEAANAAAVASVVARFGECDLLDAQQGAAYDAALFPLLESQLRYMSFPDLLNLAR
jgi:hypothetical protein